MDRTEQMMMLAAVVIVVLGAMRFIAWIWRGFASLFSPSIPVDIEAQEWAIAKRVCAQPRQRPDGTWERAQIEWKSCDAPVAPNSLEVHDRRAPGHDPSKCKHCLAERPGNSAISYRTN